jgi:hypothetical protein
VWYLLAILLLLAFPLIRKGLAASWNAWKHDAASLYSWSQSAASFLSRNNGWLKIAAAFLAGVVTCYVVSHGVTLPSIDWPTKPPVAPVEPALKPTTATYVYEKDNGTVPSSVAAGLDKLNRQGLLATAFEEDTTDGNGQVPAQYVTAKVEATKAGLPALVVQAGDKVTRVVKAPTSEQQVLEAIAP